MNTLDKLENEFDCFMNGIGYERVSLDVGDSPTFENADYINRTNKTIVELKILNKEFFENGGIIDSLNAIITKPTSIDERGLGMYTFQIPKINREGKNDNFEEPLRRIMKKANKQIRETKAYYSFNDENIGFLILAQNELKSLSPEITGALVQKILCSEFSSIDGVVICSPHGAFINPVTQIGNPECVSITKEANFLKKKQCMEIANLWVNFYENGGHANPSAKRNL